jgi:hypothetical protein
VRPASLAEQTRHKCLANLAGRPSDENAHSNPPHANNIN